MCLSIGWGWGGLQKADWSEEGQTSGLPPTTNRWVCVQPHTISCRTQIGVKEKEERWQDKGQEGAKGERKRTYWRKGK